MYLTVDGSLVKQRNIVVRTANNGGEQNWIFTPWPSNYTISYNANGGTGAPGNQTKTHGTALTLSSAKPTRANSNAGSYKVTFNANGGSVSPASMDAARTTSYTFKNWNTKADGSGTSYNAGASYTANAAATLYAQWNSSTKTAQITLPTPTRTGYTFKGWGTSSTATSGVTGNYTPTGNVTLYAVWEINKYTIAYNANGGSGAPGNQIKTYGQTMTLSSTKPTRADSSAGSYKVTFNANGGSVNPASMDAARTTSYTFKNWNTKADGSGTSYNAGASYTANAAATLYAQWNSSTKTAEITLPTPIRGGCDFKGWGTSSDASSGITGKYTPSGNVTLYAIWTPKTYDVAYDANGGTGAPSTQIKYHGTDLAISSTKPTRADSSAGSYKVTFNANGGSVSPASMDAARTTSYTFKNWNTKQDGSGTSYNAGASYTANEAAALYAQWNSSTATAAVTLPTPTRIGYDFKGWAVNSEAAAGATGSFTPDGNTTLYAIWATPEPDFILPMSLTIIGEEAFEGGAFTYARIPEGTTRIERRAFADCPNLTHVYIPESATSIDPTAFSGASSLTIHGKDGSYAEFYASKYGFAFIAE